MRRILLVQFAVFSLAAALGQSYASFDQNKDKCPATLSHDDARAIASNEPSKLSNQSFAIFKPYGDMASQMLKKGTSKAYTEPKLVASKTINEDQKVASVLCKYKYSGKLTGRAWEFEIDIPLFNAALPGA